LSAKVKAKYLLLFGIINFILYFTIEALITTSEYDFLTPLDLKIPFIPEFIWIYHSFIPVIILSLIGLVKSKRIFLSALGAFFTAMVILSLFYVLLPSYYPRDLWPTTTDTLSDWLLNLTRAIDAPNNTLPSGHNTFCWMIAFFMIPTTCAKKYNWMLPVYFIWAGLITASTLVLKQHYIVDAISGIVLAFMCYKFAMKVIAPKIKEIQLAEKNEKVYNDIQALGF
jgi:membrane-associated phospholipid phosphatase